MAQQTVVQYVRYYTPGSAAQKVLPASSYHKAVRSAPKKRRLHKVYVDPVATLGIVVAVCMLISMVVGIAGLNRANREVQATQAYVDQLNQENERLSQQYRESYNLKEVEQMALIMGMIPQAEATRITISVPQIQPEQELTTWQQIGTFLTGLFA